MSVKTYLINNSSICLEFICIFVITSIITYSIQLSFAESSESTMDNSEIEINNRTNLNVASETEVLNNTLIVTLKTPNTFNLFNTSFFQNEFFIDKIENIESLSNIDAIIVTIKNQNDIQQLKTQLEKDPLVKGVIIDRLLDGFLPPKPDILQPPVLQQIPTGINRIGAEPTSPSTVINANVAVLDSGIDANHPDLNVLADRQVYFRGTGPEDNCEHGTHVAGIIGAKHNSFGVVGVAPGVNIWNVKVMELSSSSGICQPSWTSLLRGLNYIADNADSIDVANLSWNYVCGGNCLIDPYFTEIVQLETYLDRVIDNGVTLVVSAGNDGISAERVVPSLFQSVITTSALTDTDGKCGGIGPLSKGWGDLQEKYKDDTLADFSNFGAVIDIAAPGVDILSTLPGGNYGEMSGTSMAAPHVTGGVAIIKSNHSDYPVSIIRNMLLETGSNQFIDCNGKGYGYFHDDNDPHNEPLLYIKNLN
jgi:subtilisin family serine protease